MGEAKRRGTFEQRKAEAIERDREKRMAKAKIVPRAKTEQEIKSRIALLQIMTMARYGRSRIW